MNIIEGQLPEERTWRALLIVSPKEWMGKMWQLGLALARANNGQLITAVMCPSLHPSEVDLARVKYDEVAALAPQDVTVVPLIVTVLDSKWEQGLIDLVNEADVDLLLAHGDGEHWASLNRIPCAVAAVRGDRPQVEGEQAASGQLPLRHIVMPTSGGPNTAHALNFLLRVAPKVKITAVYISPSYLGENEEALGRSRLRQMLSFVNADNRIETKVVVADSITEGIVQATSDDCDLVVIGASLESSVDKVLFGDIPAAVVRQSKKPVVIVRQPPNRFGYWGGRIIWRVQNLLPRMNVAQRTEAYTRIRRGARPDVDFYMLISLATLIAALGLIVNSTAVVIGAMLVAPLMSPMVGMGMAIVLGDARFLRLTIGAVIKGALLAIGLGAVTGLLFMSFQQPLTTELAARTQPSLLDLAIALFSGLAAAYALSRSDAAGALPGVAIAAALVPPLATVGIAFSTGHYVESLGALLLFITNLVSISSATALMFLVLGFRPARAQKSRREVQVRSVRVALFSLFLVTVLLGIFTFQLAQEQAQEARIYAVVEQSVAEITGGRLDDLQIVSFEKNEADQLVLTIDLVVRSEPPLSFSLVQELQTVIGTTLQSEGILDQVALTMEVVRVTALDPLVPPTATPTPLPTGMPLPTGTSTPP